MSFIREAGLPATPRKLGLRGGRAGSSAVEQEPFKLLVTGSNPVRLTELEIPKESEGWSGWVGSARALQSPFSRLGQVADQLKRTKNAKIFKALLN